MKNMLGLSPVIVCVGGTRGDIYGTRGDLVVVLKVNLVIDFGYSLALAKSNKTMLTPGEKLINQTVAVLLCMA